jgi:hypothetical protein
VTPTDSHSTSAKGISPIPLTPRATSSEVDEEVLDVLVESTPSLPTTPEDATRSAEKGDQTRSGTPLGILTPFSSPSDPGNTHRSQVAAEDTTSDTTGDTQDEMVAQTAAAFFRPMNGLNAADLVYYCLHKPSTTPIEGFSKAAQEMGRADVFGPATRALRNISCLTKLIKNKRKNNLLLNVHLPPKRADRTRSGQGGVETL